MYAAYTIERIARCVACDLDQVIVAWGTGRDGKIGDLCGWCAKVTRVAVDRRTGFATARDRFVAEVAMFPALPPEPPTAKNCGECPAFDMYADIVRDLISEPDRELREQVAARWFCHVNPRRRCRGVAECLREAVSA